MASAVRFSRGLSFLFTMFACVGACSSTDRALDPDFAFGSENTFIRFSGTACFGSCVVVNAFAFPDGVVFLKGARPGLGEIPTPSATRISRLQETDFEELYVRLLDMGLHDVAGEYNSMRVCETIKTDHSTLIIEVSGLQNDKIVYYLGCEGFAEEPTVNAIVESIVTALGIQEFVESEFLRDDSK